jgi:hypothetical protein
LIGSKLQAAREHLFAATRVTAGSPFSFGGGQESLP